MPDVAAAAGSRARGVSWPRVLAVIVLVAACFLVANSCQRSQVRLDQRQAVATAREKVDFEPTREQVHLVREGLTSRPFWAVSLSVPRRGSADAFERLAVVRIDANSGKVDSVATQPVR